MPDPIPKPFSDAPALFPMAQVRCEVGALVSLGRGRYGERRYVTLLGGTVSGLELNGTVVEGGVDWQIQRDDSVLEIAAHYVVRSDDGALIEVRSDGLRYGPAEVMARLARGETVPREAYFFRTLMRFETGATRWLHLNKVMAIACGMREAHCVTLDVWRIG
ncbi:MAG: DUF3237 domain-containing protein [Burkholderiaceae bacterium]